MTAEANNTKITRHWPTMLLGLIVGAIFMIAVFSFKINSTETAVVTTFGKIEEQPAGPGLHFRWPYPVQEIFKFDNRYCCFNGNVGKLEETMTKTSLPASTLSTVLQTPRNFSGAWSP